MLRVALVSTSVAIKSHNLVVVVLGCLSVKTLGLCPNRDLVFMVFVVEMSMDHRARS